MNDKVLDAFNKLAADYEKHVDQESGHNIYYERPAMMELLQQDLSGKCVLDAGCAAGWYTEQLLKRGAEVTAVDLSPTMIEACKRRIEKLKSDGSPRTNSSLKTNSSNVNVLNCDLSQPLPFGDETFDMMVSSLTLHYIEDWEPVFREFERMLKPGGSFMFSVHHPFMDVKLSDQNDYFALELVKETWNKKESGPVEVTFYRRSMQDIVNVVARHFTLEKMIEPQVSAEIKGLPEAKAWCDRWYDHLNKNPHFLVVKCNKKA